MKAEAGPITRPARPIAAALLIAAACLYSFGPSLAGEFLNYDDRVNFVENDRYRGLSLSQLQWMFSDMNGHYQPITWLSHGLDFVLWGMDPRGYHAVNLAVHCASAMLLYWLLLELLPRVRALRNARGTLGLHAGALAGALLFAVHPLRVESVAWITERKDVLFLFFALASLLLYLRAQADGIAKRQRQWVLAGSVALFALSIFSKAMSMTLPPLLLLIDAWPLGRLRRAGDLMPLLREKIPFFAVMAAGMTAEVVAETIGGSFDPESDYGIGDSLSQPAYRLAFYFWKTLVPTDLIPVYILPADRDPTAPLFLACAAGVLAVTVSLVLRARQAPALLVAWLAFGGMLAPTLGVVHAGYHFAADRNTYFAHIALAALVAGGLAWLWTSRAPAAARAASALLLVGLIAASATASRRQSRAWTDSQRLWEHTVAIEPENYIAQYNLGHLLAEQGSYGQAVDHYSRAIWAREDLVKAYYNRALAWMAQGQIERAITDLDRTLELEPEHWLAWANRGSARLERRDFVGAKSDLSRAIELQPERPRLYEARAQARRGLGDEAGAVADITQARARKLPPRPPAGAIRTDSHSR